MKSAERTLRAPSSNLPSNDGRASKDQPPLIDFSVIALVLVNLVPIFSLLFLGWSASALVLLYWFENLVVGVYNLLRMAVSRDKSSPKLLFMAFFTAHYGIFCFVHGIFVLVFVATDGNLNAPSNISEIPGLQTPESIRLLLADSAPGIFWPAILLIVSHGITFIQTDLLRARLAETSLVELLLSPYARIVLLHLTITLGAVLSYHLGSPLWMLLFLVFLKSAVDLMIYMAVRKRALKMVEEANAPEPEARPEGSA